MIYEIAGLRILIENRCNYTTEFCKSYLSADQNSPADLSVKVSNETFYEEKKYSSQYSDGYIENICLYREICRQMPSFNRILLHSAVLEYDGNGYAFLGRSGAGKSTHTGLWLKYLKGSKIVNGDKPILEYTKDGFIAYGTPWMGKEFLGENRKVALKGLCFIEKAPKNEIMRLSLSQVSKLVFPQILMPTDEENAVKTLELTDKLLQTIPAYLLKCDISEEAVKTSYEAMTGQQYEIKGK